MRSFMKVANAKAICLCLLLLMQWALEASDPCSIVLEEASLSEPTTNLFKPERNRPRRLAEVREQMAGNAFELATFRPGNSEPAAEQFFINPRCRALLASHDAELVNSIHRHWRNLLNREPSLMMWQRGIDRMQLDFDLHPDGSISDLRTVPEPSAPGGSICLKAVLDLAPFPKCTPRLQKAIGRTPRHARITFHYSATGVPAPPFPVR